MSEKESWGAKPLNEEETSTEIPVENIKLKMVTSEGTEIKVSLLQVINQLFIDLGHFDLRVRKLEDKDKEKSSVLIN